MKSSSLRQAALLGVSLALAACGAHDGSSPQLPTSPAQSGTSPALGGVAILPPPGVSSGVEMQAASVGPPPTGFKTIVRVNPRPGFDGVIRGESPLTVEFDLCDSTADADMTLFYLYDWDFDNIAEAGGTGTACKQEHTYRVKRVVTARGDETIQTNICVANADIRAHNPKTFVSCREFTVVIPIPQAPQAGFCHSISSSTTSNTFAACRTGATQFCDNVPITATNSAQALAACEACEGVGLCRAVGGYWCGNITNVCYLPVSFCGILPGEIAYACGTSSLRWAP